MIDISSNKLQTRKHFQEKSSDHIHDVIFRPHQSKEIPNVSFQLIHVMKTCFSENSLKANAGKCHLIVSSKIPGDIHISNIKVTSESKVKLLGLYVDNRLNFNYQVSQLCLCKKVILNM